MAKSEEPNKKEYNCEVCGQEITQEMFEAFDGLCEECWNDQLDEEFLEEG